LLPIPDNPNKLQMWQHGKLFREIDSNCYSPQSRLQHMNNEGIDIQVLSTVPVMFSYFAKPEHGLKVAQYLNNDILSICEQYSNRFLALCTLPLQNIKMSVQELTRCMKNQYCVGIEIGSHVENWNLDDDRFYPLWDAAERLGACIFVHPWEMMGEKEMPKYWLAWLVGMPAETCRAICCLMFGGILKKYPKLRFCFAHGGGSFAHTIGRIQHGYECRPDLVQIYLKGQKDEPYQWKGKFWVDSLIHDENAFNYLLSVIGINNIILGTDYPFPLGECYPLKKMGQLIEHHTTLNYKEKTTNIMV
jgi:aminocarboxymuconate-semialdehyde decarboxylase